MGRLLKFTKAFLADREDGGFSIAALVMLPVFFLFMAAPINVLNVMTHKERYQGFVDTLAYTALHEAFDQDNSIADVKQKVLDTTSSFENSADMLAAITPQDIIFGVWDEETRSFTPQNNSRKAVRIELDFAKVNSNPISDLFYSFVDNPQRDLKVVSYATTYRPNCFRNGLIALKSLILKNDTNVGEGVCLHGLSQVIVYSGGSFAENSEVAVLTEDHLHGSYASNPGLEEAVETGRKHIALLSQIGNVYNDLNSQTKTEFTPSYITTEKVLKLGPRVVKPERFTAGRIHYRRCKNGRRMKFERGKYENFVLISPNCAFTFAGGVTLTNVMIVTQNNWAQSFFSFNRLALGKQNDCADGNGAVLMSKGGAYLSAGLFAVGSQIISNTKIFVESGGSKRNVIKGSSLLSKGDIVLGAKNDITSCKNDGTNEILEVDYFKLAH